MKKELRHNLAAVLFNALVGMVVAFFFGFELLIGAIAPNLLMIALAVFNQFYTGVRLFSRGVANAGLLKEIWIGVLMENFYPDGSWLIESTDMSAFVDNNTINLADAGVDPVVLVNNTTYPIAFAERTDVPIALPLDYYDSTSTVIRNATAVQLAYAKMVSVVSQHRNAIFKKNLQKAAHAYGPSANGSNTPVIEITTSMIKSTIAAQKAYDELEVPQEGRILVLSPAHKQLIQDEDYKLFNMVFGQNGSNTLYGFKVFVTTVTPVYDGTTKAKKAFGAAGAGSDLKSSLFYSKYEVMRADGTYDMFATLKDPGARGDIIGFQKRFLAMPIRNKYIGAIIGNAVA